MSAGPETPRGFSAVAIGVSIAVGVFAFSAYIVLTAYAPALDDGRTDPRAHALSVGAIGYAALADLMTRTGTPVIRARGAPGPEETDALTILTPPGDGVTVARAADRTLIVLPKWRAAPDPEHPGWILTPSQIGERTVHLDLAGTSVGLRATPRDVARGADDEDVVLDAAGFDFGPVIGPLPPPDEIEDVLALQTVSGAALRPVWTDPYGRIVLGRVMVPASGADTAPTPSGTYVLAEPDLLNTMGLAHRRNAETAHALIAALSGGGPVRFDLTAFGYERPRNLVTLALEPPFLSGTVAGLFAAILLGLHATARFGRPAPEERGFALGKAALADNAAALLGASGKTAALGPRYARLVRGRIAAGFGIGPGDARDLDARAAKALGENRLAEETRAANAARGEDAVLDAARRLHEIKESLDA